MLRPTHAFILPALLSLAACGTATDNNVYSSAAPTQDAGSGAAEASTGPAADVATQDPEEEGGFLIDSGFTGDGSLSKDAACAVETVQAEEIPIDLFIMADSSGSMVGNGWASQTAGLKAFFENPLSKGISVAVSFFPQDGECTSVDPACSGSTYYKPQVQWGKLPGHAAVLADAIGKKSPEGCTPTQDALNGVLRGSLDRQKALKDHVVAAVIVSDGEPCCDMCPIEEDSGLGQIAFQYANPSNGDPAIKTFAIYAASSASGSMTAIAVSGGTQQAFNATGGTASFIAALDQIRTSLLACEYKMPVPEAGVVNPEVIEVEYTPTSGTVDKIPRVKPPETCGSDQGWHYDDETSPTRIILCPATCDDVQDDPEGRVDILVGCESGQR